MMGFITLFLLSGSISFFCLGLYVVTSEGMLLHFLRKPFDKNHDKLELLKQRELAEFKVDKRELRRRTAISYLLTPVIGCVICYGSFWTIVWHGLYFGFDHPASLIHSMFMVTFMNAFLVDLYDRL